MFPDAALRSMSMLPLTNRAICTTRASIRRFPFDFGGSPLCGDLVDLGPRVAVSSTGCRPCKIASTSSGLKEGVTNERSDVAPGDAFVPPPILEGHSLGRTLCRTCSDVRSMFPILWQVGYTINDNVSVWVTRPDESYKKEQ